MILYIMLYRPVRGAAPPGWRAALACSCPRASRPPLPPRVGAHVP